MRTKHLNQVFTCVFYGGQDEESIRRVIWEKNMLFIEAHNKEYELGIHTYNLGMNHFGDMVSALIQSANIFLL